MLHSTLALHSTLVLHSTLKPWQLDTLYSHVMLKTWVRVESKSREINDLLMWVSYHFPLEIALESRIAHQFACRVLAIDTYRLTCQVLVIDTHRLTCRVLAIVSHSTRELVLSCICGQASRISILILKPNQSHHGLKLNFWNYCVDYSGSVNG